VTTAPPPDDGGFHPTNAKPTKAGGGRGWFGGVTIVLLILVAVGALLLVRGGGGGGSSSGGSPEVNDHIHVAYGINVCGAFLPDPPEFVTEAGDPENYAGLHTHADGLIHIEPTDPSDAGENATLGRYFQYGGGEISEDSITMFDGTTFNAGESCVPGEPPTELRWSINGEEQDGNPADYHVEDEDKVVVALIPEGGDLAALGEPPSTPKLADPTAGEAPPPTQ